VRGFGFWSRFTFGAQVLLAVVFAVGAAVLAIDLADWKYVRYDLSASGRNTLDESVLDILDGMPEDVVIDVFFQSLANPYAGVSFQAQNRMMELLAVASRSRRNKLTVTPHDPADLKATQLRQKQLGVEGQNLVVYTSGGRKAVQHLFGEIAVIDWGNPTREYYEYLTQQGITGIVDPRRWDPRKFGAPKFSAFRGEEVLAQALLKISSGSTPRAYFSVGQGEPSIHGSLATDLGLLRTALERDGFEVLEWDPSKTPAVPEDCEVLGLIGTTQPFPFETLEHVKEYVSSGGRVIAAPDLRAVDRRARGGVVELLSGYGMESVPGLICEPVTDINGQPAEGVPECSQFYVDETGFSRSHPLTEPLIRRGRRVLFALTNGFERSLDIAVDGTLRHSLVSSSPDAWRDLETQLDYDYIFDPRTEERSRFALAMLAEVSVKGTPGSALRKGRVLGFATSSFLLDGLHSFNRDFLLNAFNWMAEREYRVRVAPLEKGRAYVDLQRGAALPVLTYGLWLLLPGMCVAMGAFLAWRRRG
jgi:hypothetical protein